MTHGSVFSGVGGFDIAADWNGWDNIFHCEINPFGRLILNYYWPDSIGYGNIETTDFKKHNGTIDILSGGFPCQDNSNANQSRSRKSGLQGERTSLAFQMLRAVDECRPKKAVVAENVSDFLTVNRGKDFRTVLGELAARQMSVPPITGQGCISLLTPLTSDYKKDRLSFPMYAKRLSRSAGSLTEQLSRLFGAVPGHVNHRLYAWLMGFPCQWLDLQHHNGVKNKSKPMGTQ